MEAQMGNRRQLSALAALVITALATSAVAQPSRPSDDIPATIERSERPVSKTDAFRFVGKVVEIDREGGVMKLQTEEGVVTVKPRPELLRAARVGEMVSVPRPENDAPSASPRTRPTRPQ
jgi:hypothetical protein